MATFTLRWATDCANCGSKMPVGTEAKYETLYDLARDLIVHAVSAECISESGIEMTANERSQLCASCHMVHAPNQKECW